MLFNVHFHVIQPLGCKMNFLNKPNMNMNMNVSEMSSIAGATESQANCWQKATPKVSLSSCFRNLEPYNMDSFYCYARLL